MNRQRRCCGLCAGVQLALVTMLLTGCAPLQRLLPGSDALERLATQVTITRDEWGVPHIHGDTDAAAVFGVAWAQAEDDFRQIEENYIHALGRAAEWYGESHLENDVVRAAFEVERLAREEYEREPQERRELWDAYAAGLNHYMGASGVQPRVITRFEPWMPFALARDVAAGMVIDGVRLGAMPAHGDGGAAGVAFTAAGSWDEAATESERPPSSAWAVAPARTASGQALLLYTRYDGLAQPLEVHIRSSTGWHVRGAAAPGVPLPLAGHNERVAWALTHSAADRADVYAVSFDDPADPLAYRYDGAWRRAVEWQDTLFVNTASGVVPRVVQFRRTHHGPVVAERDGRSLAARVARMEEGGSLQQSYAMSRAQNIEQFRTALDQRALPAAGTLYADVYGNIQYLHGSAVPVRDTTLDWTRPVDGSTSASEWRGYHPLSELPQLLNPASGWIQTSGSSPFHATADGQNPDPAQFPAYMAPALDHPRARAARRVLEADSAWTFETLSRAAFDAHVDMADLEVPALAQEWEEVGGRNPARARPLDDVVDTLRTWNRVAATESAAMTLFVLWQERLRSGDYSGDLIRFRALEDAVARLQRDHESTFVEWGALHRLQRVPRVGSESFSEDAPSVPIGGGPGWAGIVLDIRSTQAPGAQWRHVTDAPAWVSAVELAPAIRAGSVVTFGQSADPASPHFFDQAALLARGELKRAHFTQSEVEAHARRTYRPAATDR